MAARVRPSPSDTKLVDMFMGILQGLCYEKMVGSSSSNFIDIDMIGQRIESGLKSGKIASGNNNQQSASKKPLSDYAKKKEEETNVVTSSVPQYQVLIAPTPYFPYPYVAAAQFQQQPFQYQMQFQQPPQALQQQQTPKGQVPQKKISK